MFQLLKTHQSESDRKAQQNKGLHGLSLSEWKNRSQLRGYSLDEQIVTRDPCALLLKFSRKTLKWYVLQFTQGLQSGDKYFKTSSLN